jgi:hypothetical protein
MSSHTAACYLQSFAHQPSLPFSSVGFPTYILFNLSDYSKPYTVAGQSNLTAFSPLFLNYNRLILRQYVRRLMITCKVTILHVCFCEVVHNL